MLFDIWNAAAAAAAAAADGASSVGIADPTGVEKPLEGGKLASTPLLSAAAAAAVAEPGVAR
jgi:hypothetical protein